MTDQELTAQLLQEQRRTNELLTALIEAMAEEQDEGEEMQTKYLDGTLRG